MSQDQLRAALANANVKAFLRVIRAGESSQDDDAYRMIVGGELIESFEDHPRKLVWIESLKLSSTAAGAYQFLSRTWNGCAKALGLHDFLPASQNLAAVYLISGRGALADVLAGRIDAAIKKCALEWASLPGSPYGQPTRTMAQALATYAEWGGKMSSESPASHVEDSAPDLSQEADDRPRIKDDTTMSAGELPDWPPPEKSMLPLVPILAGIGRSIFMDRIGDIVTAIPRLASIFAGDSAVAQRNVKAVEIIADTIGQAVGAKNAQEVVEAMQDPAKVQAARDAIDANWAKIHQAAEESMAAARDFGLRYSQQKDVRIVAGNMTFLELLTLLLVLVGMGGGLSVLFWADVGDALKGSIIMLILVESVVGVRKFWLGNSQPAEPKMKP